MLGRNGVGARDLTDEVTDERGKDGIVWRLQHAETDLEGLQDLYPCSEIPEPVLGLDPKDRIASKELFGLKNMSADCGRVGNNPESSPCPANPPKRKEELDRQCGTRRAPHRWYFEHFPERH